MPKFVLLWTDAAMWTMAFALAGYTWLVVRRPGLAANWRKVFGDKAALASSVILLLCLAITLLDSVHYRPLLPATTPGETAAYDTRTRSLLDALLARQIDSREATYSRPLSTVGFTKESVEVNGRLQRVAPRLKFGGAHLTDPASQWLPDLLWRGALGLVLRGCRGAARRRGATARWPACARLGPVPAASRGAWCAGPSPRWVRWPARC
jgi:peptide/nickel transport system permease protein